MTKNYLSDYDVAAEVFVEIEEAIAGNGYVVRYNDKRKYTRRYAWKWMSPEAKIRALNVLKEYGIEPIRTYNKFRDTTYITVAINVPKDFNVAEHVNPVRYGR